MLTFYQLLEVKRSPDRAEKLARYLHSRGRRNGRMPSSEPNDMDPPITTAKNPIGYNRRIYQFLQRNPNHPLSSIPLHKVVTDQETIGLSDLVAKIRGAKLHEPTHPQYIYDKNQDRYHVYDGNHRTSAAKLLGRKKIRGHLVNREDFE